MYFSLWEVVKKEMFYASLRIKFSGNIFFSEFRPRLIERNNKRNVDLISHVTPDMNMWEKTRTSTVSSLAVMLACAVATKRLH
jgi:hypothetical protein